MPDGVRLTLISAHLVACCVSHREVDGGRGSNYIHGSEHVLAVINGCYFVYQFVCTLAGQVMQAIFYSLCAEIIGGPGRRVEHESEGWGGTGHGCGRRP